MANTSFDDLVRQEQQAAGTGKIDRAKERMRGLSAWTSCSFRLTAT